MHPNYANLQSLTGDSFWIALSLWLIPTYPVDGYSVRTIVIEADLIPLYLQTPCQQLRGWDLLNAHLDPGDFLHLMIPVKNIERLWCIGNEFAVQLSLKE